MIPSEWIHALLFHFRFLDIFTAFCTATLIFACRCRKNAHFRLRAIGLLVLVRLLCLLFAYTYGGNIFMEVFYSAILILLILVGLRVCYDEPGWNLLFYFSCGFMTWYITDRLFLLAVSILRLNGHLRPFLEEGTITHIFLYIGTFIIVYLFIYLIAGRRMQSIGESEIPAQNTLLSFLLVSILTPILAHTSFIIDHMRVCHGATAPSSMVMFSSWISVDSSTTLSIPVPSHLLQAPWLLKASSSAPGA